MDFNASGHEADFADFKKAKPKKIKLFKREKKERSTTPQKRKGQVENNPSTLVI